MPNTAIYSTYRDVGPALGTLYAIHCHIQHIQGCGTCSRDSICHTLAYTAHTGMGALLWGLYMPYTGIYSTYRDGGPALGTLYAIHCHIEHIQGGGACSLGQYMPYTAIYSR